MRGAIVTALLVGAATAAAVFACGSEAESLPSGGGPECTASTSCPEGTQCIAELTSADDPCDAGGDSAVALTCEGAGGRCRLSAATRAFSRNALIEGFRVPSFHLDQLVESDRHVEAYRWAPPADARVITCAVFTCPPQVRARNDGELGFTLDCFDECVVERHTFEPADGIFDLRVDYTPAGKPLNSGRIRSPITTLVAGCWAYDASCVVAATPLVPVLPQGLFPFAGLFDLQCTGSEGGNCALSSSGELGTCTKHRCARRCVTHADCIDPTVPSDDGGVCIGAPSRCEKIGKAYVGTCSVPNVDTDAGGVVDAADASDGAPANDAH